MEGWNTIVSFWDNFGLFSGATLLLVSGSVYHLKASSPNIKGS